MENSLAPGLEYTLSYLVPEERTVPALLPESEEFKAMPRVLATGYMVGLVEWACIKAINPHLDWPLEQSVGTHVNLSHTAATPPGLKLSIQVKLDSVEGRKLTFSVKADDGVDVICTGTHERYVIDPVRFNEKVSLKK